MSPAAGHDSQRVLQNQVFVIFVELPGRLGLVQLVFDADSGLLGATVCVAALMLVSVVFAVGHDLFLSAPWALCCFDGCIIAKTQKTLKSETGFFGHLIFILEHRFCGCKNDFSG